MLIYILSNLSWVRQKEYVGQDSHIDSIDVDKDSSDEEISIAVNNHLVIGGINPLSEEESLTAWRRARDFANKNEHVQFQLVQYMITEGIAPSILKGMGVEAI